MNPTNKVRRWWVGGVVLAFCFLALDSDVRMGEYWRPNKSRLGNGPSAPQLDPASPTGYALGQRRYIMPENGMDSYHWIMQTQRMLAGHGLRCRFVDYDNAPHGREVHWSSLLPWWLAALSWIDSVASGNPWPASVERVAPYATTLLLGLVLLMLAPITARRFGAMPATLLVLGMVLTYPFYEYFMIGSADHHGIVASCCLMTVLFLVAAGAGWVRVAGEGTASPEQRAWRAWLLDEASARRWFIASAIAGGTGLWISAATQVPVLLGTGVGAVLGAGWGPAAGGWRLEPRLWRYWGWAGAATSFFFYLLEYFPFHMGWRLEVNHPLYALAWLGAGEILCRTVRWLQGNHAGASLAEQAWLVVCLGFLGVLPLVVLLAREETFWVADPFLWRLHVDNIMEFWPVYRLIPQLIRNHSLMRVLINVSVLPLLGLALLYWLGQKRLARPGQGIVLLVLMPGLVMLALSIHQIRWLGVCAAMWLVVLVATVLVRRFLSPPTWSNLEKSLAAALLAAAFVPHILTSYRQGQSSLPTLNAADMSQMVPRDTAYWLRRRLGSESGTVLCGPTLSSWLAYFGNLRGVGTLYWENKPGLRTAAAIYAASSDEETLERLRENGVTHIAVFSWGQFLQSYVTLQRGLPLDAELPKDAFMVRLVHKEKIPCWLRPLYFPKPQHENLKGQSLIVFEVLPQQTEAEAATRWAQCWLWEGNHAEAEKSLRQAFAKDADFLPALLRQALVDYHLGRASAFQAIVQRIRQLEPGYELPLEDRISLAEVLRLANDRTGWQRQLARCLTQVDERRLRRLEPAMLLQFVNLLDQGDVGQLPADLMDVTLTLLPPEWQAGRVRR